MPYKPQIQLETPKTVTVIRMKSKGVKDPIRFPGIQKPIEDEFEKSYLKMMGAMVKMLQIEMLKQTIK